jgi:hypothetical protein
MDNMGIHSLDILTKCQRRIYRQNASELPLHAFLVQDHPVKDRLLVLELTTPAPQQQLLRVLRRFADRQHSVAGR